MTNKKEAMRRLNVFIIALFLFMLPVMFFAEQIGSSAALSLTVKLLYCTSPALASLIARAVTKEGFRDMKLHLAMNGNLGSYLLAFALPLFCVSATIILPVVIGGYGDRLGGFTFADTLTGILMTAAQAAVVSVTLPGEELGWRGYMNTQIGKVVSPFGTCILGGLIWSAWHLPIDMLGGIGFGEEFRSSLYNIVIRSVLLICFGVFLMWLTEKTDSLFPAVIARFAYNIGQAVCAGLIAQSDIPENAEFGTIAEITRFVPFAVVAVIFMVLLMRVKKQEKRE